MSRDRGGSGDRQTPAGPALKFPVGRFEEDVVTLIFLVQVLTGLMAVLLFVFWVSIVLASLYHPWMLKSGMFWEYFTLDWHPGVFALAVAMGLIVVLLGYLYE